MTGKLHEILAVEPDLRSDSTRVLKEVVGLFRDAPERLFATFRSYFPLVDDGETFADESSELTSTVSDELALVADAWGRYVDATLTKEATNQTANAILEFDDIDVKLPATALLNLESRLQELRTVYSAIPTLDPKESWTFDEAEGFFASALRTTYKTAKVHKTLVAQPATEEHPAQVHIYQEDDRVGHWENKIFSGMLTKEDKRKKLARIDNLLRAVKKARQRANDIETDEVDLAESIVAYING